MWQKGYTLQGKYRIEGRLGKGGFGITYKAVHIDFDDWVVIKTPNATLQQDPEFVKRFHKEALTLWKLGKERHPHIVRVTDFFTQRKCPCLVMQFIAGEDLYNRVQRLGALSEGEVVGYLRQIGSALSVVHKNGLVHRDVKPNNIIITQSGEAILIDFGIVGEISSTTMNTKTGTPAFAPPEQFLRGMGRKPTFDIYSLAASCYYAVTGREPDFNVDQELIFPKQFNPHISDTLNQAIIQGMQRKAKNRPQTIAEWLELFQSLPSSPPTQPICTSSSTSYIPSSFDSEPEYLQPTVVPKEKEKPRQKKKRKEGAILKYVKQLPWFWLLILLEGCAFAGFVLGTVEGAVVGAVVGAVGGAVVGAVVWAVGGAVIEAVVWAVVGAVIEAVVWAVVGAVGGAVGGAVVWPIVIGLLAVWVVELILALKMKWIDRSDVLWAVFWAVYGAVVGAVRGAVAGALGGVVAGAVYGAVYGAVGGAVVFAIEESKNENQGLLITLGTAVGGLGIGWLLSLLW